jgi:hypothetical protein
MKGAAGRPCPLARAALVLLLSFMKRTTTEMIGWIEDQAGRLTGPDGGPRDAGSAPRSPSAAAGGGRP